MREIPNDGLTPDLLPLADADWTAIMEFALTFNGYDAAGGFQACAAIADARRHDSLTDLRTCLFFEQRRWRHWGVDPDEPGMEYIRDLVEKIRQRVAAGDVR